MGKLISWVAVILLLAVVPFGSWYYLKGGLDYRKKALSELIVKDSIPSSIDSLHLLSGKTTVLSFSTDSASRIVFASLLKQFEKTPGFQVMNIDTMTSDGSFLFSRNEDFSRFMATYEGKNFVLVDTSLNIRNSYSQSDEEIRKLIEHVAIVIPRQKESDIQLKK